MTLPAEEHLDLLRAGIARTAIDVADIVLPAEHFLEANGLRLRYLDWGNAGAPRLIFLHGGGLTANAWDLVCLVLRDQFHCVALEQRGHGESSWPAEPDYQLPSLAADLVAFMDHLGKEAVDGAGEAAVEQAVEQGGPPGARVIGHSMGGLTTLFAAGTRPERFERIALVDVGPRPRAEGVAELRGFVETAAQFDSIDDLVRATVAANPRRNPDSVRRSLRMNLRQLADGRWQWKYDRRRYQVLLTDAYKRDRDGLWEKIARVRCPALVVQGERSRIFFEEDALQLVQAFAQGTRRVIPNAGHNVHADNPKALAQALREFFTAPR